MPALVVALCLLASFTSINGAFLGLARLASAMASQRVLPGPLAKVHAASMLPRRALTALLPATLAFVVAIDAAGLQGAVLRAAAVAATSLYAVALCARGRAPFHRGENRCADRLLAAILAAVGVGVVLDAGDDAAAVMALLALATTAGAAAAFRLRSIRREIALAQTP